MYNELVLFQCSGRAERSQSIHGVCVRKEAATSQHRSVSVPGDKVPGRFRARCLSLACESVVLPKKNAALTNPNHSFFHLAIEKYLIQVGFISVDRDSLNNHCGSFCCSSSPGRHDTEGDGLNTSKTRGYPLFAIDRVCSLS